MQRNSTFWHLTPRILHTQAFRIVLVYVLLYAVSATALVAFTYWNSQRALDAQTDQTIEAEVTGLTEQYERLGVLGLSNVITSRVTQRGSGLYLLQSPTGRALAGNLLDLPEKARIIGSFVEFDYQRLDQGEETTHTARGQAFFLSGGYRLLVARDVSERPSQCRIGVASACPALGLGALYTKTHPQASGAGLPVSMLVGRERRRGSGVASSVMSRMATKPSAASQSVGRRPVSAGALTG